MDSIEAARIFHDWAYAEGFMPDAQAQPTSTAADYAKIQNVTDKGRQLLRAKGVQAIASNDVRDRIIVFTKRATPASKKQLALLPTAIDNIEIEYRQGVQQPIGTAPILPFGGPAYIIRNSGGANRYTCGSSISVGNFREAGTLGCLVRDAQGEVFGLSNNHVSGSCSFAGIGLPILAPGVFDVVPNGLPPFTIGFHHVSLPMVSGAPDNVQWMNNSDAAIFKLANPAQVSSFQGSFYDTPAAVGPLSDDLQVEKVGRTTGRTSGRVIGQVFGAFGISYTAAQYGFAGVVYFEPVYSIVGIGAAFSAGGDSGSLITSVDENGVRNAVGIVVGGMQDSKAPGECITIALPIAPILQNLGVTLLSGHNV